MFTLRWIQTNPNPRNLLIDDCTVRALSIVLGCTWDEASVRLDAEAFRLKVMPDSRVAFHSVMKSLGFKRKIIPDTCPECYTVEDFRIEHPKGTYVLATDDHVVTIRDGCIYDTWDPATEVPEFYWEE